MKSCLLDNDIEKYSTRNKGKSVAVKKFIETLKSKIYEHMKLVSKNVYFDRLDETVEK